MELVSNTCANSNIGVRHEMDDTPKSLADMIQHARHFAEMAEEYEANFREDGEEEKADIWAARAVENRFWEKMLLLLRTSEQTPHKARGFIDA